MSDTQINVGMNVDGVVAGTNKAKSELRTLQAEVDKVARASKEGGAALGKVGEGVDAEKAAKQLSRIAQQVKRVSDEAVLGRNSVELFAEKLAKTGVNAEVYRPLLDAYSQVRKSTEQTNAEFTKAGRVLDQYGNTAKGTAAALRQVPAQFTDIIVSLQGGQAPLAVLLQQGGQLKDVFGGVGAAAKALGGYIAGLVNPFTVTAAAIATVGYAAYQGSQDIKSFELALALSGNASGVTTDQMRQLALATGSSADALAQFAKAGVTGTEGLQKFADAAVRFEKFTGIAVKDSVAAWKSLGDEPVKNALKLNETVAFLTPTIYAQIKALEAQGKSFEASLLAQNAYAQAQNRIADGAEAKLNGIAYGWDQIAKSIGGAWKALKDFTNGDPVAKQIADSQARIKALQDNISQPIGFSTNYVALAQAKEQLKIEQQRLFVLQSGQSLEKGAATEKAAQNKQLEAQAALDREHDKYLTKAVERERELAKVRESTARANAGLQKVVDYGGAGAEQARKTLAENERKLAEVEAGIRKRFAEPKGPAAKPDAFQLDVAKAYAKAIDDLDKVQLKASASADTLSKTQEVLRGIQDGPEWAAMSFRKKEEIIMAASLAQAEEDRAAVLKSAKKVQDDYNNAANESANSVAKKLQSLGDETRAYAVATEMNISLAEAIDLVAISRLEEEVIRAKIANNGEGVKQLEREIELRKELRKELNKKANNTAEVEAGKAAAAATLAEWKRGWSETDRIAREAFTTWATEGGSAAQKIGDTLKKALLSAVYEATLKPLVFQVYSSVAGGGGVAGTALQAASGASGGIGSLGSLGTAASAFGGTFATGFINTLTTGGIGSGLSAAGSMMGQGFWSQGLGMAAGALGPVVAGVAAIQALTSSTITSNGSALLANLGGGTTHGVAIRNDYTQSSSGIFSGGTTHNSDWLAAGADITGYINDQVKRVTDSARAYGTALGLPVGDLDNFKQQIEVSLTGLNADQAKEAINKAIGGFGDALVSANFGPALDGLKREGEDTGAALVRLGNDLSGVNAVFAGVQHSLLSVDLAGAATASSMVAAAGGLANFQAQVTAMYGQLDAARQAFADANRNAYELQDQAIADANSSSSSGGGDGGGGNDALKESIDYLAGASLSIREWLDRLNSTDAGGLSADAQRTSAWASLQSQLTLARGGDRDALSGITGYADSYIDTINKTSKTEAEARLAIGKVRGQLAALPGQVSPEQFIVDAINANGGGGGAVATAVKSLGSKLTAELTVSARSEIVKMIEFVVDTDKLPNDLKQLALASADTMTKTVSFITGSKLSEDNKQLALGTESLLTKTISYALGQDIPDEYKKLALKTSDSINKSISFVARNVLDPKQAEIALMADNSIVKTIETAAKFLNADALKVAYSQSEVIRKMLEVSGGVLTEDQATLLDNIAQYNKTINLFVAMDASALTSAQEYLQRTLGTIDIQAVISGGGTNSMGESIPTQDVHKLLGGYINDLGADGLIDGTDVGLIVGIVKKFGGTMADIAKASGWSLQQVQEFGAAWGIPEFAVGTDYIPRDMLAMVHKGEQIVPAAYNPHANGTAPGGANQTVLVEEIRALRTDNQAQALALVQLQKRMNKLLERWDGNGMPETRVVTA